MRALCGHLSSSETVSLTCSKAQSTVFPTLSLEREDNARLSVGIAGLSSGSDHDNQPLFLFIPQMKELTTEGLSKFPKTTQLRFIRARGESRSTACLPGTLPPPHAAVSQGTALTSPDAQS